MQVIKYPDRNEWKRILQRPYADNRSVSAAVQVILAEVKKEGDKAVIEFAAKFDGVRLENFLVTEKELTNAASELTIELKAAIQQAKKNVETFHQRQVAPIEIIETMPGIQCWRKSVGIEKVGLYIPGGTAPLFSTVLMLAIPATIAGCKEIILCTPCDKEGKIHPAILYAAQLCGITKIFKAGGAQAIAAMAYGTETIPAVYKIFGPGNQYVTAAKQLVQLDCIAIDMPAGPSEVCVLADATANPKFIAADLLSQAEHGADSQVLLVSCEWSVVCKVQEEIEKQLGSLYRKEVAKKALVNSKAIIVEDMNDAIDLINEYAAEHLIISCAGADSIAEKITNAGSVFIGNYSPESVGDYASGTNHTLPTNGFAKAYSGVSVDSFVKKITYQKLSEEGLKNIAATVVAMAEAEGLDGHAAAIKVRTTPSPPTGGLSNAQTSPAVESTHKTVSSQSGLSESNYLSFGEGRGEVLPVDGGPERLVRENIKNLKPYSSARSEFSGNAKIYLDANENSFGSPLTKWYNRYPDPLQWDVKKKLSGIKNIEPEKMLLGNGSDECIDLLIRAFCNPQQDNIIICPPTYGMYEVYAHINDVPVKEVPLTPAYQLNLEALEQAIDAHTKIIFFCSPNNPTGNSLHRGDIETVLNNFDGLVVVDEAYINYSRQRSFVRELKDYPNLVVMQTFSKAWGLAALRLGMIFASTAIVDVLNKIKPPYNINQASQELALKALDNLEDVNAMIKETVKEREMLISKLEMLPLVEKVFPTDANFVLVKMKNATAIYTYLKAKGIIVRNRSNVILCEDSLRITVGTPEQNEELLHALQNFKTT